MDEAVVRIKIDEGGNRGGSAPSQSKQPAPEGAYFREGGRAPRTGQPIGASQGRAGVSSRTPPSFPQPPPDNYQRRLDDYQRRLAEYQRQMESARRAARADPTAAFPRIRQPTPPVTHEEMQRRKDLEAAKDVINRINEKRQKKFADDAKKASRTERENHERNVAAAAAAIPKRLEDEAAARKERSKELEDDFRRANRDLARRQKSEARAKKTGAADRESTIRGIAGIVGQVAGRTGGSVADLTATALTAGGPLAIASAAITAAKAVYDAMQNSISAVGQFTRTTISASDNTAHFVSSIGQSIPIIGNLISQLGGLMHELDGLSSRFGEYSPRIAVAEGMGEIVHTMNEIRRAQEAAPALEAYVRARTELQQQVEDAKVRMMQQALPMVLAGMESLGKMLPFVEGFATFISFLAETVPVFGEEVRRIRLEMEKSRDVDSDATAVDQMKAYLAASEIDPKTGARFRGGGSW